MSKRRFVVWTLVITLFFVLTPVLDYHSKLCANSTLQPQSGSVPRNGFDLYYRIVGDRGPYIIILAGGPGLDVDYMYSVTQELAKNYRCVLLEQRGTGRSQLKSIDESTINFPAYFDDLEALRQHLKQDKLILFGHSWGMTYALAYASEHPNHVCGIVTVGSAPITAEFLQLFGDNRASRLHPSEREALEYWSEPNRSNVDPDRIVYEYLRAITPTDFYDRKKGLEHAMKWQLSWCHAQIGDIADKTIWNNLDLRPKLKMISCPVLFVHGYQDVSGEANVIEAKNYIKDATIKFVHRCGHYPWLDQPVETWQTVLPFLAKISH